MTLLKRLLVLIVLWTAGLSLSAAYAEEALNPFRRSDGKWGYVNGDHCWAIEPRFADASHFQEGLAAVTIGKKWGFIDKTGRVAINPQFDAGFSFRDGRASVLIGGTWGYIDKTGRWLLDPICSVSH
jgi:hypothetical protein